MVTIFTFSHFKLFPSFVSGRQSGGVASRLNTVKCPVTPGYCATAPALAQSAARILLWFLSLIV